MKKRKMRVTVKDYNLDFVDKFNHKALLWGFGVLGFWGFGN